jgi:hypothetical protein
VPTGGDTVRTARLDQDHRRCGGQPPRADRRRVCVSGMPAKPQHDGTHCAPARFCAHRRAMVPWSQTAAGMALSVPGGCSGVGRRCSPSPSATPATTTTPAPRLASRCTPGLYSSFSTHTIDSLLTSARLRYQGWREGLHCCWPWHHQMACCKPPPWHPLQVVGEAHDVEEGAPVLKKTVFGEQSPSQEGTFVSVCEV